MLNRTTTALALLAASPIFGQEGVDPTLLTAADKRNSYEKSAAPVCPMMPCSCDWASFETWVDFLYWQAIQENMEPAGLIESVIPTLFIGTEAGSIINMNFEYKPGFQVGFGVDFDHRELDLRGQYTRYTLEEKISGSNNGFYPMQLDPATLIAYLNGISVAASGFGTAEPRSFFQQWTLSMNIADLELGHWQFNGKVLMTHPFVGARAAVIEQTLFANYIGNAINGGAELGFAQVNLKTTSWGVGIRGGIDTDWRLGKGFKFYGNGAGDLLFTDYKWSGVSQTIVPVPANPIVSVDWNSDLTQNPIHTLRLHLEAELGLTWAKCWNDRYGLELTAGYGMQIFFDQNMFRHFTTVVEEIGILPGGAETDLIGVVGTPQSTSPNGNLYIQGLRVEAAFRF